MDYDLIVLGLGPGGEAVAGAVAEGGKSVLGVDERLVGGECPYFGCIPSKMAIRGAELLQDSRRVNDLPAGSAQQTPDYAEVARRIRDEATDDWNDAAAVERFEGQGAAFVRSHGRLAGRDGDRFVVEVDGDRHTAAQVVISTGTRPSVPPIDGLDEMAVGVDDAIWTNREILQARVAPESMVVLGGGVISSELAQAFRRFGVEVIQLEGSDRLLSREEPEAGEVLRTVFEREGIDVRLGVKAVGVEAGGKGVVVSLSDGSSVTAEKLLVAAGRTPNLDLIGLETIGLDPEAKSLEVDDHMAVDGVPGLFALGDVTGKGPFTHVAVWQAAVLTQHLLGQPEEFGGYDALAWATFTDPEVGRVGLTEQDARDRGLNVRVGVQQISSDTRGWIYGVGNDGFVKVIEDADRGVLVGATVCGPHGGELIGMLTTAVHGEVPVAKLRTMHYVFPTLHRSVLEAVQDLS